MLTLSLLSIMKLTEEQERIIHSNGNLKINAVAGSGKTTTVIEYAKSRPKGKSILYLAFNRSVKLDAQRKFNEQNQFHVSVETAHSLAFKHVVMNSNYRVRGQGYKTNEIAELLKFDHTGDRLTVFIIASHVLKYISFFCNSDKSKVTELDYLATIKDEVAKEFVSRFHDEILHNTRLILAKMDKAEIEITHDFYLKKFQLKSPQLHYDYILFDEGQDASPAMMDVFFKQKACKVIVGDKHQQIYAWRYAVNSLQSANFPEYHLSNSFRFNNHIASLATRVLEMKAMLSSHERVTITGKGNGKGGHDKAIIARSNLGLLLRAIDYVSDYRNKGKIYFEGSIHSYTYADDGTSLYDVLNLSNGKHHLIRDKMIAGMRDLFELEEYVKQTEDLQLGMMLEIVDEYGDSIPEILNNIKEKHVEGDRKEDAAMIFSTVHRCKGMEYDEVELVDDFVNEEAIEKLLEKKYEDELDLVKLNEEINLLYVAVTRTRNILRIPFALLPKGIPTGNGIIPIESKEKLPFKLNTMEHAKSNFKQKSFPKQAKASERAQASYQPWTRTQDDELAIMYGDGIELSELAAYFGRSKGAVLARIKKLDLDDY